VELQFAPQGQQTIAVRAHQVRHGLAAQAVAMKPNAAVEGEANPLTAAFELAVGRCYLQVILPSTVPGGPTGVAVPEYR
jgi:hypothetical protein